MKMKPNISRVEFCALIIMFFCYVMALFFLISNERNYALLFFVLHAILMMANFCIIQSKYEQLLLDENEQLMQKIGGDTTENEQRISLLEKEKSELEKRIKELTSDVLEIKCENEKLLDELSEKKTQGVASNYNMLLPADEQIRETDLLPVIKKVCDIFEQQCRECMIRLELATSFDKLMMRCDERYIIVMLSNIVDNAIKYMNRSGSLVITISDVGDDGIFIVCKDNGEGLDAKEIPYIFDLNYQGANRKSGNGLGLAQVKAVVEHYDGTVYAKGDNGKGMAIYIQFPIWNKE